MKTTCTPSLSIDLPETKSIDVSSPPDASTAPQIWPQTAALIAIGAGGFHLAFAAPILSPLIFIYLWTLAELTRAQTGRRAFYAGLVFGLLIFVPKLGFFYTIFNIAAVPLWMILALWHSFFLFTARWARANFKPAAAIILIAVTWTGFEYFRSELYFLKFSWLSAGYAFAQKPNILLPNLGLYGAAFAMMLAAAAITYAHGRRRNITAVACLVILTILSQIPPLKKSESTPAIKIAGIQLEFPVELEVPAKLDLLLKKHPDADLFVLSEYTFDGPIPPRVLKWCKQNRKHLIAGGKDPAGTNFYNTAFVIDPNGEIIFKQVKAVPIQFFKDGLPAPEQKLWNSPWGKIGLGVCYDLSYTRVVDNLIKQGAELLIFPTMDVVEWGRTQHELHALIAPTRAAEYQVPIYRLASSGISQAVNQRGQIIASAPFPGENETLYAELQPVQNSSRPIDRYLSPVCSMVAVALLLGSLIVRKPNSRGANHKLKSSGPCGALLAELFSE